MPRQRKRDGDSEKDTGNPHWGGKTIQFRARVRGGRQEAEQRINQHVKSQLTKCQDYQDTPTEHHETHTHTHTYSVLKYED